MSDSPAPAATPVPVELTPEQKKAAGLAKAAAAGKVKSKKAGKKQKFNYDPCKGTRDMFPDDQRFQLYLFNTFRDVASEFSFEPYDAPMIESQELFKRKAGEEITEQMYAFDDKAGRAITLRPEMTPSLARMVLQKGKSLTLPAKWYSIPQCWRYETTCRGRSREHYQWNMDIVGVKEITAEVELLAAMVSCFEKLGLTSDMVGVKISSRKVLQDVLSALGVSDDQFPAVCVVVDKLDKLPAEEVEKQLADIGVTGDVTASIMETLQCKTFDALASVVGEDSAALKELKELFSFADAYGIGDWLVFDASVVRGLAYYTGVVWEAFDRAGVFRAIAGGGRYDKLFEVYGSKKSIPCVGFGFGDCVIKEMLGDLGLKPSSAHTIDDVVIPMKEELRPAALRVLAQLRASGRKADIILGKKKKLGWCYTFADRCNAERAILLAPEEWKAGKVKVKFLKETNAELKEVEMDVSEL